MRHLARYTCLWIFLVPSLILKAQLTLSGNPVIYSTATSTEAPVTDSNTTYIIKDIAIKGNNKTRTSTIIRELSFQKNEEYPLTVIVEKFRETQKQLMNTGLFRNVVVSMNSMQGFDVYVNIEVEERWYVYPIPYVRIVDENIQQWWTERKRDITRVNYGMKLHYNNVSGRNDKLNLYLMNGYTKQASLRYEGLFLDKQLKWSTNISLAVGMKKEVNYMTFANKTNSLKDNSRFIHQYFRSSIDVIYRRAIKTKHIFTAGYFNESVADTIYKLNPKFAQGNNIRFPFLSYRMTFFDLDYMPYPTKGYAAEVSLQKKGFNDPINVWQLTAKGAGSWPITQKMFFNLRTVGMIKLPFQQPYINQQFLGGDDMFIQGYEYYVIDGVAGGYTKLTLTQKVLDKTIRIPSNKIKRLNNIPLKVFAKTYGNLGYVHNPQGGFNSLNNRPLYSGGFGLDILTFTDLVIKLEWTFNHLGENGLYLHRRNYF